MSIFLDSIVLSQFVTYIYILSQRFNKLHSFLYLNQKSLITKEVLNEIVEMYGILFRVARYFNGSFSIQILLKLCISFTSMIGTLFSTYLETLYQEGPPVSLIRQIIGFVWFVYGAIEIFTLCIACTIVICHVSRNFYFIIFSKQPRVLLETVNYVKVKTHLLLVTF